MERMGQWVQLHVESEMHPNDVAEFLALVSSPTSHNNNDEYDAIEEDDVNDVFVVENDDDDNHYIWFYKTCYLRFLLMYAVLLEFRLYFYLK